MNHGGGMANQQPQQPYFIPRVAGVPQPPPQPPQPLPQSLPHPQLPPEYQTPAEAAFQPPPPPPPPAPPLAAHPLATSPLAITPLVAPPQPFVGRTPFAVPPKSNGGFFRAMAHYCWMAVLLSIGVNLALNAAKLPATDESTLIKAVILGAIWISGMVSGIIALFGVRRHGRPGILIPALVGLFFWIALVALTVLTLPMLEKIKEIAASKKTAAEAESAAHPAYTSTPSSTAAPVSTGTRKAESTALSPAIQPEGSTRVEDKDLGFSLAILEGYALPENASPEEEHLYKRKFMTEPTRIIEVRKFDGDFSRHLASAENFPPPPPGQTSESAVFDWRGRKVGGTRSVDSQRNPSYLMFNIVIPLRKQAIVVTVGGAEQYEPVLQEVVDQVLGSLAEESN